MSCSEQIKVSRCEHEIARLLARLEKETGELVEDVKVSDVEVTVVGDERPQIIRRVQILLKRIPGHSWAGVE